VSDHCDGNVFFNPTLPKGAEPGWRDMFRLARDPRGEWPGQVANTARPNLALPLGASDIALTFVNHATFLIQLPGCAILTDPVWSERVSPVSWAGPARIRKPGVDFNALPKIDLILISHNHYDHLDLETLRRLKARGDDPLVLVPLGDREIVSALGFTKVRELDWWQSSEVTEGVKVVFTPTQHFSGRTLWDRQRTLWGSYMIQAQGRNLYFGGDSGYSSHFAEIRRRLGAADLALLGIGAYSPRWFMARMHMDPSEAVQAHQDLGSALSVGMHFETFRLSSEAYGQPERDLAEALRKAGIGTETFVTLQDGETRLLRIPIRRDPSPMFADRRFAEGIPPCL